MDSQVILAAKLRKQFPDEQVRAQVEQMLNEYGSKEVHKELERVRLAILKLSSGDVELVKHNVQVALTDYRDVLYWAEYSQESALWEKPDKETLRKIRKQDAADYAAWLKED